MRRHNAIRKIIGTTGEEPPIALHQVRRTSRHPWGRSRWIQNSGPLAFNGGRTRTHAFGAGSPGLDAGSNSLGYAFDQRGPAYLRSIGSNPDIGAFESDTDHIFGDGIDHPYTL